MIRKIILFTLLVIFGQYLITPQPIHGLFVSFSNFREVSPNLFVSANTSGNQIAKLKNQISESYSRNDSLVWGTTKQSKKIIFCSDIETFAKFCPDTTLQAVFISSFYLSHIVIGPNGFDIDILSHEICHAEFFDRLGFLAWLKIKLLVPVWFDEGLAMQVNFGETYRRAEWKDEFDENSGFKNIDNISSYQEFFGDQDRIWINYFASKLEVEDWLKVVHRTGLAELVDDLSKWNSFGSSYVALKFKGEIDERSVLKR